MHTRKKGLLSLLIVGLLVVGGVTVYKDPSLLKGAFGDPDISGLCPSMVGKTIYVKEGASSGGAGTKTSPYNSIASAQTALEGDSTIKRVCFSGSLTGSLDLDDVSQASLILTAYSPDSGLVSSVSPLHMQSGSLENLIVNNLEFEGTINVSPSTSLILNEVNLDGKGHFRGLWVSETDTVTISNSTFKNMAFGFGTTMTVADSVGTVSISDTNFDSISDTAVSAYYLNSLSLNGVTINSDKHGVYSLQSVSVSIEDSTLSYGKYGFQSEDTRDVEFMGNSFTGGVTAVYFKNSTIPQTSFTCANNFILSHTASGMMNNSKSKVVASIVNNSFYGNALASSLLGALGDIVYSNNIYYSTPTNAAFASTTMAVSMTSDFNLFFGKPAGNSSDLNDWQNTGLDGSSVEGDPLFTSATDLHISSASSPAIDAGTDTSVTEDIDGDARTSGSYDIGADEY